MSDAKNLKNENMINNEEELSISRIIICKLSSVIIIVMATGYVLLFIFNLATRNQSDIGVAGAFLIINYFVWRTSYLFSDVIMAALSLLGVVGIIVGKRFRAVVEVAIGMSLLIISCSALLSGSIQTTFAKEASPFILIVVILLVLKIFFCYVFSGILFANSYNCYWKQYIKIIKKRRS